MPPPSQDVHRQRQGGLDLLRVSACAMVVCYHYAFLGHQGGSTWFSYEPLAPIARYGILGVQLFFLISGWVVLASARSATARAFAIARAVRILPTFWISCATTTAVVVLLGSPAFSVKPLQFLSNMAVVPFLYRSLLPAAHRTAFVDTVYWTLSYEIKFYLSLGVLSGLRLLDRVEGFLWAWLLLTVASHFEFVPHAMELLLILNYSAYFIAGAFFQRIQADGLSPSRGLGVLASLLCALHQVRDQADQLRESFGASFSSPGLQIGVLVFFALLLALALGQLRFSSRTLSAMAAWTFPAYLLHQIIGYTLMNLVPPSTNSHVLFWGELLLVALIACLYARFVEKPVNRRFRASLERWLPSAA